MNKCGTCAKFRKRTSNEGGQCLMDNGRTYNGVPVSHIKHTYDKACRRYRNASV